MKHRRQPSQRRTNPPVRLRDLPDVFGVAEFCAVLGISERTFYRLRAHGCLPVRPLKLRSAAIRFSNTAVQQFLAGSR